MILEACLILLTLYVVFYYLKPKGNFPPGPMCLPFVGSLPYFSIEQCKKARSKYGNIFMTKFGALNFVYICDFKIAKEYFSKPEFANRPSWECMYFFEEERRQHEAKGIVTSNGKHWVHNRRFLLRHLRDLGMGKSKIEGLILREVEDLVEEFKGLTKEPSTLPIQINIAVLNIIWQLVSSHRYDFGDEKLALFMKKFREIEKDFMLIFIIDLFPIVKYIIPKPILDYLVGKPIFERICQDFKNIIQPFIDDHLKTLDPNNPRDLMDDYLIEMKEKKNEDYSHFDFTDLTRITFDLFAAGNETTSNMTRWFLIYMARFQEIQEKIQKEIDRVVQRDTLPGLEHRNELRYLDATINEVQRHCSMASGGVPRCVSEDVKLEGFDIPKGTVVTSLAALSHRDPIYFKDPDKFDPSRFLDENGKYFSTCDGFQAFGIGKRQCLGEQFARMELYLITAALLHNFTFAPPDDEGPMSLAPVVLLDGNHPRNDQKFIISLRS